MAQQGITKCRSKLTIVHCSMWLALHQDGHNTTRWYFSTLSICPTHTRTYAHLHTQHYHANSYFIIIKAEAKHMKKDDVLTDQIRHQSNTNTIFCVPIYINLFSLWQPTSGPCQHFSFRSCLKIQRRY